MAAQDVPGECRAHHGGEGERPPTETTDRKFIVRRACVACDQRLLLGEFREIDPARCALDRVSLLMSALRTVHDPALIPPPRRAGLGPGRSFAPASAAGAHCGALYNEGIARKDPVNSPRLKSQALW